jgi:hypothetical protein
MVISDWKWSFPIENGHFQLKMIRKTIENDDSRLKMAVHDWKWPFTIGNGHFQLEIVIFNWK